MRVRTKRFETWDELLLATLAACRQGVQRRNVNGDFDVDDFEVRAQGWLRRANDLRPYRVWRAVQRALTDAVSYLDGLQGLPSIEWPQWAILLDGLLSSPCRGNDGKFSLTVRERLPQWGASIVWPAVSWGATSSGATVIQ